MIKEAISLLVEGKSLTADQAAEVMTEIMEGEATAAQFGALVVALRLKGETVEEISGLARTMRSKAVRVACKSEVVDTCGTGGDCSGTFNISTAAAFVTAAAGQPVAKHGNRAISSNCGSADVLEALGVKIDLNAEQVTRSIDEVDIGFMFAPLFHPAMKHAAAPRRELGIRTVFNILGPLTNPAAAAAQVIGVADLKLAGKLAEVLRMLGVKRAMVVHGSDGLDEITVTAPTYVCELKDGNIDKYIVNPEELGFKKADIASLKGGDAIMGAAIIKSILNGETGLKRDTVVINSAAALKVGGKVATLKEGVALAEQTVDSGKARAKLEQLVGFSNSF